MIYPNVLSNYLNKSKQNKMRLKVIFWQRDLPLLAPVLISKGMRGGKVGIIFLLWPYGFSFIWISLDRNFQKQRMITLPAFKYVMPNRDLSHPILVPRPKSLNEKFPVDIISF